MSTIFRIALPARVPLKETGEIVPFEPWDDPRHMALVRTMVSKWAAEDATRQGYELAYIDRDHMCAVVAKAADVASVEAAGRGLRVILDPSQRTPSAGAKVAAWYEQAYAGHFLTEFHPYEGWALLERLDEPRLAARAIIANALRAQPWQVQIAATTEGGWAAAFPDVAYSPSQHDSRLHEAAEQIGKPGWWFEADAKERSLVVHPGELPTFPKGVPFPFDQLGDSRWRDKTPYGIKLVHQGQAQQLAVVDWTQSLGALVAGLSGGGKSVTINTIIASQVANGVELFIADHFTKSTDFYWVRPWIADNGWGCDSLLQTAGLLKMLLDDISKGGARAEAWRENGWQSWYSLPDDAKRRFPLRLVVVDEISQLTVGAKDANTIPKSPLPPVMERLIEQQTKAFILKFMTQMSQIGRAYGYRLLFATQVASNAAGLPPALRANMGNKLIMGSGASDAQRQLVFNDARAVPHVPENIVSEGVSKGAGMAEFEGQSPFVSKTYWAGHDGLNDTQALGAALCRVRGLPDGISKDDYLASLDPDARVNRGLQDALFGRIAMPTSECYERLPLLVALNEKLQESMLEYGMGGGDEGTGYADAAGFADEQGDGTLIDAAELARRMEES